MSGYAYLDFQAACMSMKPLMADAPGPERLMHRAKSVCLHEIGHTPGLHDHYDEAGRRCVMHGTVSAEELYETAAYSSGAQREVRLVLLESLMNYLAGRV